MVKRKEVPKHLGCEGILRREHVGIGKISIRCSFCKKVLDKKELKKHDLSGFYSESEKKKYNFNM